jgi:hypothetical protein
MRQKAILLKKSQINQYKNIEFRINVHKNNEFAYRLF